MRLVRQGKAPDDHQPRLCSSTRQLCHSIRVDGKYEARSSLEPKGRRRWVAGRPKFVSKGVGTYIFTHHRTYRIPRRLLSLPMLVSIRSKASKRGAESTSDGESDQRGQPKRRLDSSSGDGQQDLSSEDQQLPSPTSSQSLSPRRRAYPRPVDHFNTGPYYRGSPAEPDELHRYWITAIYVDAAGQQWEVFQALHLDMWSEMKWDQRATHWHTPGGLGAPVSPNSTPLPHQLDWREVLNFKDFERSCTEDWLKGKSK